MQNDFDPKPKAEETEEETESTTQAGELSADGLTAADPEQNEDDQ